MYTLTLESENPKKRFTIKLDKLEDIYEESEQVKNLKKS